MVCAPKHLMCDGEKKKGVGGTRTNGLHPERLRGFEVPAWPYVNMSGHGIEDRRGSSSSPRETYIPRSSRKTASLGAMPLRAHVRRYIPASGFLLEEGGRAWSVGSPDVRRARAGRTAFPACSSHRSRQTAHAAAGALRRPASRGTRARPARRKRGGRAPSAGEGHRR